jgi:hypothetical protein
MYDLKQMENAIRESVIYAHDFSRHNPKTGEELFKEIGHHLINIVLKKEQPCSDKVVGILKSVTPAQKIALKEMLAKNGATPLELKNAFVANKLPWHSNISTGCAIGGLNKRFVKNRLGYLVKWDHAALKYNIVPEFQAIVKKEVQ